MSTPPGSSGHVTPNTSRIDLNITPAEPSERSHLLNCKPVLYLEDVDAARGRSIDSTLEVGPSRSAASREGEL